MVNQKVKGERSQGEMSQGQLILSSVCLYVSLRLTTEERNVTES